MNKIEKIMSDAVKDIDAIESFAAQRKIKGSPIPDSVTQHMISKITYRAAQKAHNAQMRIFVDNMQTAEKGI